MKYGMKKDIHAVAFRVPNTEQGNLFIKLAREYINRPRYSTITTRPRGNRPTGTYDSMRKGCKSFGVYLHNSKAWDDADQAYRELNYMTKEDHRRRLQHFMDRGQENLIAQSQRIHTQAALTLKSSMAVTAHIWQAVGIAAFAIGIAIGMLLNKL